MYGRTSARQDFSFEGLKRHLKVVKHLTKSHETAYNQCSFKFTNKSQFKLEF